MNRITTLRKGFKLSQAELAKKTGISRQAISLYEIGKRSPSKNSLIKLSKFFGVPVNYINGSINGFPFFEFKNIINDEFSRIKNLYSQWKVDNLHSLQREKRSLHYEYHEIDLIFRIIGRDHYTENDNPVDNPNFDSRLDMKSLPENHKREFIKYSDSQLKVDLKFLKKETISSINESKILYENNYIPSIHILRRIRKEARLHADGITKDNVGMINIAFQNVNDTLKEVKAFYRINKSDGRELSSSTLKSIESILKDCSSSISRLSQSKNYSHANNNSYNPVLKVPNEPNKDKEVKENGTLGLLHVHFDIADVLGKK